MIINTGYKGFSSLRQKNVETGEYTGVTKSNDPSDPDYISPIYDPEFCEKGEIYLNVDFDIINMSSSSQAYVLGITSNTSWVVISQNAWITIESDNEKINDDYIDISIARNEGGDRSGTFTVSSTDGSITKTVTINQTGVAQYTRAVLGKSSSGNNACSNRINGFYTYKYIDHTNFQYATNLFDDENGTQRSSSGYYSNGFVFRYWNGNAFGSVTGICKDSNF